MTMESNNIGPLAGLRVLEMSQIMAGPVSGVMLADMGAEVIKIEKFPGGDDSRGYARPGDPELAPSFLMLNRGKRSVAVDIRKPEGQEVIRRLVARCDVLTENFRRGKLNQFGLGYDDLKQINPALIYCSISGYGPNGPLSDQGGFDLVLQAFSGLISTTGTSDGEQVKPANSVADINAGILAVVGILAAYVQRLKTGSGCKVETSLLQASIQQMYWFAAAYFHNGAIARPMGTAHPLIAPYQTFKCRTGAIALGGGNQPNWLRIVEIVGHPEWATDPRFKDARTRVAHRGELETLLTAALASDDAEAWVERFDRAGVPVGPVHDVKQALEHPQTAMAGMVVEAEHADGGTTKSLGLPIHFNNVSPHATSAAPYVGGQTVSVLREFDFTQEEIDSLLAAGAISQR